jgi:hypothetical protein
MLYRGSERLVVDGIRCPSCNDFLRGLVLAASVVGGLDHRLRRLPTLMIAREEQRQLWRIARRIRLQNRLEQKRLRSRLREAHRELARLVAWGPRSPFRVDVVDLEKLPAPVRHSVEERGKTVYATKG